MPSQGWPILHEGQSILIDGTPIVRIAAVGDVMLGGRVAMRIRQEAASHPFKPVKHLLSDSDFRLGNLEYPLTETLQRHPVIKHHPTHAPPEVVEALKAADFTLLGIANNHIFDCLDEGLADTVSVLKHHGIGCVGAGSCLAAARAPALHVVNGIHLGFLAYTFPLHQIATDEIAGCAPNDPDLMREDIQLLKGCVDHIIVSIHAGREFYFYPTLNDQQISRMLLEEGATAVLYHHGHVPNGIEIYKGKLIAYGLGNFLCDIYDDYFQAVGSPWLNKGLILYLNLDASRLLSFEVNPTLISPNLVVHPMQGVDRQEFLKFMHHISVPLYETRALERLQPKQSLAAKAGRLVGKAKIIGLRPLMAELISDAKAQLDRRIFEPGRVRALRQHLKSSPFHIEPNPMVSVTGARRILFLADCIDGGTGNHLFSLLKHWDKSGWQAKIVSQARRYDNREPSDVPVELLPSWHRFNRYPIGQVRRLGWINKYLAAEPSDLVHSYFFWSIVYGRLLKRLGKIRFLVENREDQGFSWGRQAYALLRLTRSIPDRVICVSEAVRQVALTKEHLDPSRVLVIHNGVESVERLRAHRTMIRQELGLGENHLIVGMVANFTRSVKGVSYFLDAIPAIIRAVPLARFIILGRGPEEQMLLEKAKALEITPYIVFAGYQEEVRPFYASMDISVLTSLTEGLSITLLESMSCGLPVVVTRVGGNPEVVVEGKTGYLVPPKDIPAFVERVVELLRNPDLRARMGDAGRRRVEQHFCISGVAERYLEIYSDLLKSTTAAIS